MDPSVSPSRQYDIPGYPGYTITRDGVVYGKRSSTRPLKPHLRGTGYKAYCLNGRVAMLGVLLCTTFHGPRPDVPNSCVVHLKGPSSSHADDVRWGTRSEARRVSR